LKKSYSNSKRNSNYGNYDNSIYDNNNNGGCEDNWMIIVVINNDDKNNFCNYNYFNNKMVVMTSITTMGNGLLILLWRC